MEILLTNVAKERILKQVNDHQGVRIYTSGKGWGGPRFALSLDEASENDIVKEVAGILFIIEKMLYSRYGGVKIDFKKTMFKQGFVLTLKDLKESCCI